MLLLPKTRQPRSASAIYATRALPFFVQVFFFALSREVSVWNLLHGLLRSLLNNSLEDCMSKICLDQKLSTFENSFFELLHPFCCCFFPRQFLLDFFQSSSCCRPMILGMLIPYGYGIVTFGGEKFFFLKFWMKTKTSQCRFRFHNALWHFGFYSKISEKIVMFYGIVTFPYASNGSYKKPLAEKETPF